LFAAVNPGFQSSDQRKRSAIIRLEGAQFEYVVRANFHARAFPFAAIAVDHRHNGACASRAIDAEAVGWFGHTFLIPTTDRN
jgi:hypothetical protein